MSNLALAKIRSTKFDTWNKRESTNDERRQTDLVDVRIAEGEAA
jgi:hypothetical protein